MNISGVCVGPCLAPVFRYNMFRYVDDCLDIRPSTKPLIMVSLLEVGDKPKFSREHATIRSLCVRARNLSC